VNEKKIFKYQRTPLNFMRSREEVYGMLREAVDLQETWRYAYDQAKAQGNKEQMRICVRNHKALEGVIKTLRWTLEYAGIGSPLM
jgi:hypothetical protein|tara:strand:+ start:1379 stop:1633 length:255 start_codon:yes stop_codon:yes gene_type:complete